MASRASRANSRVQQACLNCRRKKIRCPGERPACSTCRRLQQDCLYSADNLVPQRRTSSVEQRLAQLETRLDNALDQRTSQSPLRVASSSPAEQALAVASPTESSGGFSLFPPRDVVRQTIDLYFRYCHRQPLWLFAEDDFEDLDSIREEVILAVLFVTIRYSTNPFFLNRKDHLIQSYCDSARSMVMLRIANSSVNLDTLQTLCLLTFANFACNDTQLGLLHLNLVISLTRCASIDVEQFSDKRSSELEARRRLFWSSCLLEQLYGNECRELVVHRDMAEPTYVRSSHESRTRSGDAPPLLPDESFRGSQHREPGAWAYTLQMSSLWAKVRWYISSIADGCSLPPWARDSDYAIIGSYTLEAEASFPDCHRHDTVNFLGRTSHEIERDRFYWGPWLNLQVVYHGMQSALNHPFLYAPRANKPQTAVIPNTFWKNASELAFLHASWVVRYIDMVLAKDFLVTDPFIGYCATVAATVHLYYSQATESRLKHLAEVNLQKCKTFVRGLASQWPLCQRLNDTLDALIDSTKKTQGERAVKWNRRLMWSILDHTHPRRGLYETKKDIFEPSLWLGRKPESAASPTATTPADQEMDIDPPRNSHSTAPIEWTSSATPHNTDEGSTTDVLDELLDGALSSMDSHSFVELSYEPFFQIPDDSSYHSWWGWGSL